MYGHHFNNFKLYLTYQKLMSSEETSWLNSYHIRVRDTLLPVITEAFPEAVQYLIERTQPI